MLDKREGCICSCHCCYLRSCELKPHVAICVPPVPAVTLGIHVQGRSRSGKSTWCVLAGRQAESAAQSPWTGKGSQRMSFGEGFSRAAGHEVAYPLAGLPREAEQHICSGPSTVLVVWEGENPYCFLLLGAFWYSWDLLCWFCTADFLLWLYVGV